MQTPGVQAEIRAEAKEAAKPKDRAVYTLPIRDNANGMDGWTLMPESVPMTAARAKNEFHTGSLIVRIDSQGTMHFNRPDEIESYELSEEEKP